MEWNSRVMCNKVFLKLASERSFPEGRPVRWEVSWSEPTLRYPPFLSLLTGSFCKLFSLSLSQLCLLLIREAAITLWKKKLLATKRKIYKLFINCSHKIVVKCEMDWPRVTCCRRCRQYCGRHWWRGECSAYYRFLCFQKHQAINKLYPHIDTSGTKQLRKLEEVTDPRRRGNKICYASIRSTFHAEHYVTLRQPRSQSQERGRWERGCFKTRGPVSRKPRKLFGPVKPVLDHLYLKTEKCIRLKVLVWREPFFILRIRE